MGVERVAYFVTNGMALYEVRFTAVSSNFGQTQSQVINRKW